MKIFLILCLLIVALLSQVSVTTIPFVLLILIIMAIVYRNFFVFSLAFLCGLLLDILTFKTIGLGSVFLVSVLFLILIYEAKFAIDTDYFIFLASFLASFCYLLIFGYHNLIPQALFGGLFAILLFRIFKNKNLRRNFLG